MCFTHNQRRYRCTDGHLSENNMALNFQRLKFLSSLIFRRPIFSLPSEIIVTYGRHCSGRKGI